MATKIEFNKVDSKLNKLSSILKSAIFNNSKAII